jgi:hypothetical protein
MSEFCKQVGINPEGAIESVVANLEEQGVLITTKNGNLLIQGSSFDAKGKVTSMTSELLKRTEELNRKVLEHTSAKT